MNKYKLIPMLLGSIALIFIVGVLVCTKLAAPQVIYQTETLPSVEDRKNNQISDADTTPTDTENFLTYQNRKFGFQFDYHPGFVILENFAPNVESMNFIDPKHDTTILELKSLSTRDKYGQTGNEIAIYAMKKGDTLKMLKSINDLQKQTQLEREAGCAKSNPDRKSGGFEECAYYGGGWNYSTTTFAGAQAIQAVFAGEGEIDVRILLPPKGILISGTKLDFLKNFIFIDTDRTITNENTNFQFNCPARWTCNYNSSINNELFYGEIGRVEKYYVRGPNDQFFELSVAVTTTPAINNFIEKRKSLDGGLTNGTPFQKETFDGHIAYNVRKDYYGDTNPSNISMYVPELGLFIHMDASFPVSRELENTFFSNAKVSPKQ